MTISIDEALEHPHRNLLAVNDLDVFKEVINATIQRFQALCGQDIGSSSAAFEASMGDVISDTKLFLALQGGIANFITWFANDDHSIYLTTDLTGSDDWAAEVLARARLMLKAEGDDAAVAESIRRLH